MGKVISTLLFQPPEQPTHLSSRKYFWLTTSKGSKIPAFFIQQNHARYTLLYSHGNAEDLGMIYDYLVQLSQLLYVNIFAYDYSGYGMGSRRKDNIAKGIEPSEQNCYADIEAAFQHLMQVEMINLSQLILYGRSVGSGPSCYLAQKLNVKRDEFEFEFKGDNVAGLILHSPFLSVCRVVVDMGLEMSYDYFPNVSRIKDVGCPTFILHGSKDEVVPFRHGQGLYEALPKDIKYTPFWAENMGHNNIEVKMTKIFIKRLQKFFLHIRKAQTKNINGKEKRLAVGGVSSYDKQFGMTLSTESEPVSSASSFEEGKEEDSIPTKRSYTSDKKYTARRNEIVESRDYEEPIDTLKSTIPLYRTSRED